MQLGMGRSDDEALLRLRNLYLSLPGAVADLAPAGIHVLSFARVLQRHAHNPHVIRVRRIYKLLRRMQNNIVRRAGAQCLAATEFGRNEQPYSCQ